MISHGSVAESASVLTVWARSAALMPVVTPSRASTEIVYAVRIRSLLCGVISGISSRSSIVPGHRHADDAGAVPDRERHQLGRRLARREDDVALVLAVLVVDDDDRPCPRRCRRSASSTVSSRSLSCWLIGVLLGSGLVLGPAGCEHPLDVLRDHVDLEVDRVAELLGAERGAGERLRDERDGERAARRRRRRRR